MSKRGDFEVMSGLLGLVGKVLTRSTYRSWSPKMREEAETWAAKSHLRASDNPVRVPPIPAHVKSLREIKFEGIL